MDPDCVIIRVRRARLSQPLNASGPSRPTLDTCKVDRRVDQTDMAERRRKIAEHAAGARVVFLGEQTEIILQREQALEKHVRIIETLLQDVIVRQPETAGEESALA
jgi:hypothetical protein